MNQLTRVSVLGLVVLLLLTGCVIFPVAPAENSDQKAVVDTAVKATVEAAIVLAVEATIAAMDVTSDEAGPSGGDTGDPAESAAEGSTSSNQGVADAEVDESALEEVEASIDNDAPLLITPTPDRSGEIAEYIVSNTRHFRGDPDAPVVLVEFSDFM